jgi:hypothetical protein
VPAEYTHLRPEDYRPIQVHHDGVWVDGWLEAYRRAPDGTWAGYVRYTTAPAEQRIGWFTEDQLRRLE